MPDLILGQIVMWRRKMWVDQTQWIPAMYMGRNTNDQTKAQILVLWVDGVLMKKFMPCVKVSNLTSLSEWYRIRSVQ